MRLLLEPPAPETLDEAVAAAAAAHAAGLDGVLLRASRRLPAPLVTAAAVAARVPDIRLGADVAAGDRHPLLLAEEAAVVDVASGGRLLLVVHPAPGAERHFAEAVDLLRLGLAARPVRFAGERWRVPAGHPQNAHAFEAAVRVTPAPVQPRLELWCAGVALEEAARRGLGHLADAEADAAPLGRRWHEAERDAIAAPSARARRDPAIDEERLVSRLRDGRTAFGQDWSVVVGDADAAALAGRVRARVQLDRLPDGLERHWRDAGI